MFDEWNYEDDSFWKALYEDDQFWKSLLEWLDHKPEKKRREEGEKPEMNEV